MRGFFSVDTVTLADDAGVVVTEQRNSRMPVGWAWPMYALGKFDGILGLGFESISIDGTPTVFGNAVRQGVVDQPVFSFYLGNDGPGELTLGGYILKVI